MPPQYGFLAGATGLVAFGWALTRVFDWAGILSWPIWIMLGAALIAAVRWKTPDSVFFHSMIPGIVGTVVPTLLWFLFWDPDFDLRLHIGLGLGGGILVGCLAALSMALTKSTNPNP